MPTEDELLALAEQAARAAGRELMSRWGTEAVNVRTKSTPTDPVSDADVAAERAIRDIIGTRRPEDAVLGEEGGGPGGGAGEDALRWIVDPLDGTVNYLYGIPQFAVSVACQEAGEMVAGIVLDPVRGECFSATRSGAAALGGRELSPPRAKTLAESLVATGFAYDAEVRAGQAAAVANVLPRARDIRRAGAAALDLCWCACGRVDAFYERGIKPWDFAAGALICRRAGLAVRELPAVAGAGVAEAGVELPAGILVAMPDVIDELQALVAGE